MWSVHDNFVLSNCKKIHVTVTFGWHYSNKRHSICTRNVSQSDPGFVLLQIFKTAVSFKDLYFYTFKVVPLTKLFMNHSWLCQADQRYIIMMWLWTACMWYLRSPAMKTSFKWADSGPILYTCWEGKYPQNEWGCSGFCMKNTQVTDLGSIT